MAEISLSWGLSVITAECREMYYKWIYCVHLERAVAHASKQSSSEMNCNINFILPLLIKTDKIPFYITVWSLHNQCKTEIWLIGKFLEAEMWRGSIEDCVFLVHFIWLVWIFYCLFGWGFLYLGAGFLGVYGHLHVEVVFFCLCLQQLSYKERGVLRYRELNSINIFSASFYVGLHILDF